MGVATHKNQDGISDVCMTDRTNFEVDLEAVPDFIEKLSLK